MLFISLFFLPQLLKKERATMREIVDKHFPDNWVIQVYMGTWADLQVQWAPYDSARKVGLVVSAHIVVYSYNSYFLAFF